MIAPGFGLLEFKLIKIKFSIPHSNNHIPSVQLLQEPYELLVLLP